LPHGGEAENFTAVAAGEKTEGDAQLWLLAGKKAFEKMA
jgi:hypothetical protein